MHSSQKGQSCLSPLPPATHSCPFPCAGTSIRMISQWAESRNQSGWKLTPKTPTVIHFYGGATNEILKEFEICIAMGEVVSEKSIPSWVSLLYNKIKGFPCSWPKGPKIQAKGRYHKALRLPKSVDCIYMQITASIIFLWLYFLFYCFKLC